MNRTTALTLICLCGAAGFAAAQKAAESAVAKKQVAAVKAVVKSMVAAEARISSLRMEMSTSEKLPGGHSVTTSGELRVLRGTQGGPAQKQGGPAQKQFTRLEYAFGDGLRGRMETSQTDAGIVLFEEDPAFGAVFVRIAPSIVADLEWASTLLKEGDLPGMVDRRARSPLGSGMVEDLMRTFDLEAQADQQHGSDKGTWLRGKRKQGLDAKDAELPLADRVEVFVRDKDRVATVARFFVGKDVVQQVSITSVELGVELGDDAFTVDGHGERIRSVQDYAPMWELVQGAIEEAEAKAKDGAVRPSRRKDDKTGSPKTGNPETGNQGKRNEKGGRK